MSDSKPIPAVLGHAPAHPFARVNKHQPFQAQPLAKEQQLTRQSADDLAQIRATESFKKPEIVLKTKTHTNADQKNSHSEKSGIGEASHSGTEYQESRPFSIKFASKKSPPAPPPGDSITRIQSIDSLSLNVKPPMNSSSSNPTSKTRDSFNLKLEKQVIRDGSESEPKTPASFKIKRKVNGLGPKQLRDELIRLNIQERQTQQEFFNLHTQAKGVVQALKENSAVAVDWSKYVRTYAPDPAVTDASDLDKAAVRFHYENIASIDAQLSASLAKVREIEEAISKNDYQRYRVSQPEEIFEARESEEEADEVDELPPSGQQQQHSAYSQIMPTIRSKSNGLNLRRTYDVFHADGGSSNPTSDPSRNSQSEEAKQQQPATQRDTDQPSEHKDDDGNKMTVNSKFRDLLLS